MNSVDTIDRTERMSRLGLLTEPAGYVDGANLYEFVRGNPTGHRDPMGLQSSTTQPSTGISLPGGPGPSSSSSITISIPGIGDVTIYAENNNLWKSGASAGFAAKITRADGCPCKDFRWSHAVKITVNNPGALTADQMYEYMSHEIREHGMNDPFKDFVPDNGYTPPAIPHNPNDPLSSPPGYQIPNQYAPPLAGKDWPDPNNPWKPGDVGFGDWPFAPNPKGANITKQFMLKLYCDGTQVRPVIFWSVRGTVGSGQNATVTVETRS